MATAETNSISIRPPWQQTIGLIASIVICFAAAAAGSLATTEGLDSWYAKIAKPTWNPPNWIFAPVWTALYLMMAVSVWLVWRQSDLAKTKWALVCFGVQLALNSFWSIIFFGWQQPGWAALEIVALWIAIAATIISFRRWSPLAAGLLLPYLAWVSFASVLNFTIWRMNAS